MTESTPGVGRRHGCHVDSSCPTPGLGSALRGWLLVAALLAGGRTAWCVDPPADYKDLDLGKYAIAPIEPRMDADSAFLIGGKNTRETILALERLSGRPIAELERDMRPGVVSSAGFLGADERLVEVLAADNDLVLGELGTTHQELAKHLHFMGAVFLWQLDRDTPGGVFVYHGRKFKVNRVESRGKVMSPFQDGTSGSATFTVFNLDRGTKLTTAVLVPHMIERYGFYEGKGTKYRLEPRAVVEVFDFLRRE